jgi:hypothetical protein
MKVTVQRPGQIADTEWAYPTVMDGYLDGFDVPSEKDTDSAAPNLPR